LEYAIEVVGVHVAEALLERRELLAEVGDLARRDDRLLEHGAAAPVADVLAKAPHGELARPLDRALVGDLVAEDQSKDRGLSGAVRADEADLLAGIDLER